METHEMITDCDHGRMVYREITLKGGASVVVNFSSPARCKRCGERIFWAVTNKAKNIPICKDKDGSYISHFGRCKRPVVSAPGFGDRLDDLNRQSRRDGWA